MVGAPTGFRVPVISARRLTPTTHAIEVQRPRTFRFRPT